ncbi:LOW QUALITY PROTEIN: uncharacterized protein LOC130294305 [Hyla sarda]|uniref:LOW QUALITY PROTEIN: uncharacterized protein LOC130294305 n=1 Tax=Hyla sarda TaxID=327740 RepID=UPI0024C3549F|nr:LOW QUALITY PROTEIN: uncharacterized protein LOC130294305 [Hyla sarda]
MENTTLWVSLENATNQSGYTDYYDKNNSVTGNDLQGRHRKPSLYEDISIMAVYSVFCLLGIIGNAIVIWFGIFGMKKQVSVVWFLSLAAADFLYAFFSLLNNTQVLIASWLLVKFMCIGSNLTLYINMVVSVLQVTVISVDRCICVVFPVWCRNHRRPRLAFIVVLVIWIISFAVAIPYIINIDTIYIKKRTLCIVAIDESSLTKMTILEFVFLFLLPFLIIVCSSILIVLHVRRRHILTSSRLLKTIAAVITAFFICWFPNNLFVLLVTLEGSKLNFYVIFYGFKIANFLMVINSCINPILYVFIGRGFKDKLCGSFQTKLRKAFMEDDQPTSTIMENTDHKETYTVTDHNVQDGNHKSRIYDICFTTAYLVFCLLGTFGNGLVIWLGIFRMKKMVNVVWFLGLAVADFSFSFFLPLNFAKMLLGHSPLLCKLTQLSLYINLCVSVAHLTVISIDRCISVVLPVWCHNHRMPRLAFIIVLVIWIISSVVAITFTIYTDMMDNNNMTLCILKVDDNGLMWRTILGLVFYFLLPFVINVSCYIVIVLYIRRKHMFASSRHLKSIVAVITAFFICWFPSYFLFLFNLLLVFKKCMFDDHVLYYGSLTTILLMAINSSINPILYVFIGRDFKDKFWGSFQVKFEKAFIEEDKSIYDKQERCTSLQRSSQDYREKKSNRMNSIQLLCAT